MGTRAAFWLGNPIDLENRKWLGCVAWDGYEFLDTWKNIKTKKGFLSAITRLKKKRDDFADPKNGGFPFPWTDDVFLTDITYAFFNGKLQACWFYKPFFELGKEPEIVFNDDGDEIEIEDDPAHHNVPISFEYDTSQPDSIMIITNRRK